MFAGPYPDDIWIGIGNADIADRNGVFLVEHRRKGRSVVRRLEQPAGRRRDVEGRWIGNSQRHVHQHVRVIYVHV